VSDDAARPPKAVAAKAAAARPCAICGKPATPRYHPFCSKRCADIDLHRWLGGVYSVPAEPNVDEDGNPQEED
jgi:endogenous inhibitor of DNA gyrase (YacG/DUF329 family)